MNFDKLSGYPYAIEEHMTAEQKHARNILIREHELGQKKLLLDELVEAVAQRFADINANPKTARMRTDEGFEILRETVLRSNDEKEKLMLREINIPQQHQKRGSSTEWQILTTMGGDKYHFLVGLDPRGRSILDMLPILEQGSRSFDDHKEISYIISCVREWKKVR